MRIGIDQSFVKTGLVVLNDDKSMAHYEIIASDPKQDIFERANYISTEISRVANIYKPSKINIEGIAYGALGNRTRDLAGLQFTIVNRLRFTDSFSVNIISPSMVKKFATGKGNSDKKAIVNALPNDVRDQFVRSGFKATTGLYDLADAYFIANSL